MKKSYKKAIDCAAKILDVWLPSKIQYDRVPGLAVGITYKGKLIYKNGFGYADVKLKVPVTPNTAFRIASISKTFTAVAIMQLVEQGKISLDDPVEKYLPWFKVRNKKLNSSKITIRQLLSHTGGVFRDGDTPHWEDDRFPELEKVKKSITDKSLVFKTSTKFKYSNFGYALLGEIINQVSGNSYGEFVTQNIIKKLNLQRTAPDYERKNEHWLARGYSRPIPNSDRMVFNHTPTNAYAAATGFVSTVEDLATFLSTFSPDVPNAKRLITKNSKSNMMKKHWSTGEENEFYGLGLSIVKVEKRKIVRHGGGYPGFITLMSLDVTNDIGVIVLTNTNDSTCGLIVKGVFETIYKLFDEHDEYGLGKKMVDQGKFEGVYRSRWGDTAVVGLGSYLLTFDVKSHSPLKQRVLLKPTRKNTFIMDAKSNFASSGQEATFVFGGKGKHAKEVLFEAHPSKYLKNT